MAFDWNTAVEENPTTKRIIVYQIESQTMLDTVSLAIDQTKYYPRCGMMTAPASAAT